MLKYFSSSETKGRIFQIVDAAVDLVEGIAVDWVGRNIYWTDYILEVIEVSSLHHHYHYTHTSLF